MATVPVAKLAPGMTVNADVRDSLGRLLLAPSTVLTERQIRMLRKWGVASVDVRTEADEAGGSIPPEHLSEANRRTGERFRHLDLADPVVEELFNYCAERLARSLGREGSGDE